MGALFDAVKGIFDFIKTLAEFLFMAVKGVFSLLASITKIPTLIEGFTRFFPAPIGLALTGVFVSVIVLLVVKLVK